MDTFAELGAGEASRRFSGKEGPSDEDLLGQPKHNRSRPADLQGKLVGTTGGWRDAISGPPSGTVLWLGGALITWLLYVAVFRLTVDERAGAAAAHALANVAPLALLALAIHAVLRGHVFALGVATQAMMHVGLASAFATTWYALVLVMLALLNGLGGFGFAVTNFSGAVFTWQVFQGLMIYAAVAATCYAIRGGRAAGQVTIVASPPLHRYFTRTGDHLLPVLVRDIVTISGAQDYAEVTTRCGRRHLVRMSLSEFERRLDSSHFLRVHRSTIINLDHLGKAESAGGGKLLAHMLSGQIVTTSRSGAQTLRGLMV